MSVSSRNAYTIRLDNLSNQDFIKSLNSFILSASMYFEKFI